jgi:hypothetical protein
MLVTVLGIVSEVNKRANITKAYPSVDVPTGIINEVKAELKNTPEPKVRRELGSTIEEKLVLENAPDSIVVNELPITIFFRLPTS